MLPSISSRSLAAAVCGCEWEWEAARRRAYNSSELQLDFVGFENLNALLKKVIKMFYYYYTPREIERE